ncbi:MAG: Hsp20/alpha crystallin family protein [Gammaproteobacteria bacterium]
MRTIDHIKQGLGHTWENLSEGWHQLRDRATHALTRFNPVKQPGSVESAQAVVERNSSRWGLLAAEVMDAEKQVIVTLEIPGMEAGDFDISVVDDVLIVRGEKHAHKEHSEGRYYVMECAYGSFERAIQLPMVVDDSQAKAQYRKGVLKIFFPKHQNLKRHSIDVQTET